MPNVWARHPAYSVALFLTLLTTVYLLCLPVNQERPSFFPMEDYGLASRLKQSHFIYNKRIAQRAKLIEKFGPKPKNVSL
jgi:hypothetical protein